MIGGGYKGENFELLMNIVILDCYNRERTSDAQK